MIDTQHSKPKYSVGDKVLQLSDPAETLTIDHSQWVGHTYRYGFTESSVEVFEEYLTPSMVSNYFPKIRSTSMLHCQCLYEIENNIPRTKFCFVACSNQHEILFERNRNEHQKKDGNIK